MLMAMYMKANGKLNLYKKITKFRKDDKSHGFGIYTHKDGAKY